MSDRRAHCLDARPALRPQREGRLHFFDPDTRIGGRTYSAWDGDYYFIERADRDGTVVERRVVYFQRNLDAARESRNAGAMRAAGLCV